MDSLSASVRRSQRASVSAGMAENAEDLNILYDVPFVIEAEMGSTTRSIRDVLKLGQGALLELDKDERAPIDLKINGHLIARGEVVELDGCYAVRISELVSQ
ncbi:MAG: FliM/FliN family flagellar motor switch protein [Candidatus Bruticola sp.]